MNDIYSYLIAVTDRKLVKGDFFTRIRAVVSLHPKALILREKDLTDAEYELMAGKVLQICVDADVPCFLHGRIEIAKKLGCRNVHLPLSGLKQHLEGFEEISVSCHSSEDVRLAERCGATQIILGTIFETACKRGLKGKGTDFVKAICAESRLPVYAIGGITPENLKDVMSAGAAGGCMMSGFMKMDVVKVKDNGAFPKK